MLLEGLFNHYSNFQRTSISAFDGHPGVHVCRRGQRGPGPTSGLPQDSGTTQGQGVGRGPADHQAGVVLVVVDDVHDHRIFLSSINRMNTWLRTPAATN